MSAPIEEQMDLETKSRNVNDGTDTKSTSEDINDEEENAEDNDEEDDDDDDSALSEGKCKVESAETGAATLSKSQLKKLRKKEKWLQNKAQKRKSERERYKARKRACREQGETLGPTRKQLRRNQMKNSNCKVKVVIDCDFDEYMSEKDISMLVKQIQHSYSANRRAENPLQFYCCGVNGKTRDRLESMGDYRGWDVRFHTEIFTEKFDKSSIVYLSSESENMLQTLEDDKVYVIGGLVDHNHHKGLCHKLAEEKGLAHAQLPISDYVNMKTRKVLAVNHVFEILLRYTETKDWQKAFYTVLPQRKGAELKPTASSEIAAKLPPALENNDISSDNKQDQLQTDKGTAIVKDKQVLLEASDDKSVNCESAKSELVSKDKSHENYLHSEVEEQTVKSVKDKEESGISEKLDSSIDH